MAHEEAALQRERHVLHQAPGVPLRVTFGEGGERPRQPVEMAVQARVGVAAIARRTSSAMTFPDPSHTVPIWMSR